MRKHDLDLRARADRGDEHATVELGLLYLRGGKGLAVNHPLALKYLAEHALARRDLVGAIASKVSLQDFIRSDCLGLLTAAAADGLQGAKAKLGALKVLQGDSAGWDLLAEVSGEDVQEADATLGKLFRGQTLAEPNAQRLAEDLLAKAPDAASTRRALAVALQAFPESTILSHLMLRLLDRASETKAALEPLSQLQITERLRMLSRQQDPTANLFLGCALLGLHIGCLPPQAVALQANHRKGYAHLLRAALSGETRAWYHLFVACCDYKSSVANSEAAQLFLEQAAEADITPALRALGARTLQVADDVEGLVRGQRLLSRAAAAGDRESERLLASFYGADQPRPIEPQSVAAIAYASRVQPELGFRLALARSFSLTRSELFKLDLSRCSRGSSLVLSKVFAVPAMTAEAAQALHSAKAWLIGQPVPQTRGLGRESAQQDELIDKALRAAGVLASDFFRNEHRSGPRTLAAWRSKAASALKAAANGERVA